MRVGVIGTNWGLMHVGGFRAAGAEVVALCGRDEAKTRAIAARERIALATTDPARLCEAVDVVVVASTDAEHVAHVRLALDAGRDVLCEKPLARTADDAAEIVAHARGSRRRAAMCFPYRALPPFVALRREVEAVREISVTVRNSFAAADGRGSTGPLMGASGDFGGLSHLVDAVVWLAGDVPAWVSASLTGRPVHTALLQLGFARGAVASIAHLAASEPGIHGAWSITAENGDATLSAGYVPERGGWRLSPVRLASAAGVREIAPGVAPAAGEREPWAQAHVETARAFLEGRPLATLADGLVVQRVIAAASQSEIEGRRVSVAPTLPS